MDIKYMVLLGFVTVLGYYFGNVARKIRLSSLLGYMILGVIFGAMAPASAPAGTVAVIQEYRARGSLTKALYAVVGFDDGLAIIIFGFAAAIAKSMLMRETSGISGDIAGKFLSPFIEISLSLLVGGVAGFIFSFLVRRITQERDYFILVAGFILIASGLSKWWPISLILTNMVIGFVLVNTSREVLVQKITKQLESSTPFFFILFFFLAGAHLHLNALPALGLVGTVYFFRTFGRTHRRSSTRCNNREGRRQDKKISRFRDSIAGRCCHRAFPHRTAGVLVNRHTACRDDRQNDHYHDYSDKYIF